VTYWVTLPMLCATLYSRAMANMLPEPNMGFRVGRALKQPQRIAPYARRALRNWRLKRSSRNFSEFYRQVMADTASSADPNRAIGSFTTEHWLEVGEMQFDYLIKHGLRPDHRLLDIGCGNLRAGWRLIEYLEPGNYVGVDLSPEILFAAQQVVVKYELQAKRPYLQVIDGTSLAFLPSAAFERVHAHSVFSHTPLDVFERYVEQVRDLLAPGGFFDFTFLEGAREHNFLAEDFRFPADTLLDAAQRNGMGGAVVDDWEYTQAKVRLRRI
jgi:SAM-dependent methyltransferase